MKSTKFLAIFSILAVTACSSMPFSSKKTDENIAANGPTIVDVRTNPNVIELNRDFYPKTTSEILAEVKDFTGNVTNVTLHFNKVPLDVPMQHLGGTTWRASLSNDQLKTLGIGDQTTQYDATVIAMDSRGERTMSAQPVIVAVKGPDLSNS